MKKIAILLLTILLANPVYSMDREGKKIKDDSVLKFDIDNDGVEDITIGKNETSIDIDGDGKTDIQIKNKTLRNSIVGLISAVAIVLGTDLASKYFGIEIPLLNYKGGDAIEWFQTYGPEVWIYIRENYPKIWDGLRIAFLNARKVMQKNGNL